MVHNCAELLKELNAAFPTKEIKSNTFLGVKIDNLQNKIVMSQKAYIDDVVKRYQQLSQRPETRPMTETCTLEDDKVQSAAINKPYRSLIGSLLYVATITRPDVLFPVSFLAKFSERPLVKHWRAALRVLNYLRTTSQVGLTFKKGGNLSLLAYSDASYAADIVTRRSVLGGILLLAGGPVGFFSKRYKVALYTGEAEYVAAFETARAIKWARMFLDWLKLEIAQTLLHIDNTAAACLVANKSINKSSKHIEIKYHFVRQEYEAGLFKIVQVKSENQLSDFLTKPLPAHQLQQQLQQVGVMQSETFKCLLLVATIVAAEARLPPVPEPPKPDTIHFERTEPIMWVETDHHIEKGVIKHTLFVDYSESPCDTVKRMITGEDTLANLVYERLHNLCRQSYGMTWLKELEDLLDEEQPVLRAVTSRIAKREVVMATVILATVSAVVVTNVWQSIQLYLKGSRLDQVETEITEAHKELSTMRQEFVEAAQKLNGEMVRGLAIAANRTSKLEGRVEELTALLPDVAWTSSEIRGKIAAGAQAWSAIRQSYRKHQVDTEALAVLTREDRYRAIAREDTTLWNVFRVGSQRIQLEFIVTVKDKQSKIYLSR